MPKVKHLALRQVINRWWFGDTANPGSLADPKSLARILVEEGYRKTPSVEELSGFFLISLLHTGFSKSECDILAKKAHAMLMEEEK